MTSHLGQIYECDGCPATSTEKLHTVIFYPKNSRGSAGKNYDLCDDCFAKAEQVLQQMVINRVHNLRAGKSAPVQSIIDQLDSVRMQRVRSRDLDFDERPTPVTRPELKR